MFGDFFYHLRARGLKVSLTEWLTLMSALAQGHARSDLAAFYALARAVLVKRVADFDLYDRAFAEFFEGIESTFDVDDEILAWLEEIDLPRPDLTALEGMTALDLDELRETFERRMREQDERHDGGSRWVGTGGRSPFGHGGVNPGGVRVGGPGGARSAVQIAGERRFRNLRGDRVLDTRQITVALRRLRKLERHGAPEELDLEGTIDSSARNAGEIDLVFRPERRNRIKLLLLMDVGGSMDPHTTVCETLFSAAHKAHFFKRFEARFFHNCLYERVYTDVAQWRSEPTSALLAEVDESWSVVVVGDAWMSPFELLRAGGAIDYAHSNPTSGLEWLERLRTRCPNSVWLNPEPGRVWGATTIAAIGRIFPMFELTLDGLGEAIDILRGVRPNRPRRVA